MLMKYNLVFSKGYEVRYISHLDLMRTFERALRRSDLPLQYSAGFNPRIKMSFALPLPVSIEGELELASLELSAHISPETIKSKLNQALPTGISIIKCFLDIESSSLSTQITAAAYVAYYRDEVDGSYLNSMLSQNTLIYQKKSKKKTREIDLKEYLYHCSFSPESINFEVKAGNEINIRPNEVLSLLQPNIVPTRIIRKKLYTDHA